MVASHCEDKHNPLAEGVSQFFEYHADSHTHLSALCQQLRRVVGWAAGLLTALPVRPVLARLQQQLLEVSSTGTGTI